jgi:CBS domain-containing protein
VSEELLDSLELARAEVTPDATLEAAARVLAAAAVGAIAVVDGDRVVGMLTEDELLRAVFPRYLDELTHTAFVDTDALLRPHLHETASRSVREVMRKPEVVQLPASSLDVAQRFLHTDISALIATRDGAFVGVIDQTQFCKALLGRFGWQF